MKTERWIFFCIRVGNSFKLRLIVMSTDLEYRARERQRKRGGRPAKLSQENVDRDLERQIKNTKETFSCWKTNMKFCRGHQCKVKMRGSEKNKWTSTITTCSKRQPKTPFLALFFLHVRPSYPLHQLDRSFFLTIKYIRQLYPVSIPLTAPFVS